MMALKQIILKEKGKKNAWASADFEAEQSNWGKLQMELTVLFFFFFNNQKQNSNSACIFPNLMTESDARLCGST